MTVFAVTDTLGRLTGVRAASMLRWPGRNPEEGGRWGLVPVSGAALVSDSDPHLQATVTTAHSSASIVKDRLLRPVHLLYKTKAD